MKQIHVKAFSSSLAEDHQNIDENLINEEDSMESTYQNEIHHNLVKNVP